jgi:hypothetical protein
LKSLAASAFRTPNTGRSFFFGRDDNARHQADTLTLDEARRIWPLPDYLSDVALETRLFPTSTAVHR